MGATEDEKYLHLGRRVKSAAWYATWAAGVTIWAAGVAAWSAARDAERKWQLRQLKYRMGICKTPATRRKIYE